MKSLILVYQLDLCALEKFAGLFARSADEVEESIAEEQIARKLHLYGKH